MDIQKPTRDELEHLRAAALEGQTENEWVKKILSSIAGILRETPLRYRGYGPYWWIVKKALIDNECLEFGEHLDREWLESLGHDDLVFDLLCAWWYEEMRFAPGQIITDPYHSLLNAEGEPFEYVSGDEEMERRK
jgi:hypothetical protein